LVEKHPHLDLPSIKESFKKKPGHGGPIKKIKRDYTDFSKTQIQKLNKISQEYLIQRNQFRDYKQELVLKVKTVQKVSDEHFRDELRKAGLQTIVSNPGKQTEWIVSAKDPTLEKLKEKIKKRETSKNSSFVDGIETFEDYTINDKMGVLLNKNPFGRLEVGKLVVSLARNDGEESEQKLNAAINRIIQLTTEDHGYSIHDKLITDNLCLLLLTGNKHLLNEIAKIDIVTRIDRTPEFELEEVLDYNLSDIYDGISPPVDSHGVLVMDSGIIKHPLLERSLNDLGIVGLPDRLMHDDRSHGTMVSGHALYGNIEHALSKGSLTPEVQIYVAKIFYQFGRQILQDSEKLIPTMIKESLEEIISKFPKCKVINLSFGEKNNVMKLGMGQMELAILIDDLSMKHKDKNIIFVISAGNLPDGFHLSHTFPNYLCEDMVETKISDPASSIHALTVGALQESDQGLIPSNVTRVGPGLNQMIKPELVEIGGGFHKSVTILNPDYRTRLFTLNVGTSFSAPTVSNYLARLMNAFPQYSRNLIKALLISSAKIPMPLHPVFPKLNSSIKNEDFQKITNVYGYGKPDFDESEQSDDNHVVLKYDGSVNVKHVRYFTLKLPEDFVNEKGSKEISVTLVFDPPVSPRAEYMGTSMEFHLFRNHDLEEIQEKYNLLDLTVDSDDEEGKVPEELRKDEIKLKPGINERKKTAHQKGIIKLSSQYEIDHTKSLILVVICQKRWEKIPDEQQQDFAVVVTVKHSKEIDLYNKIRAVNQTQVQTDVKTQVRV